MITNERQLQISKAQAARFRDALHALEGGSLDGTDLHPLMKKAQVEAVRSQLENLLAEIQEYEALRSGRVSSFDLNSLAELPEGLIRARIAAGLTQRELADRLGMREQQIQRYESNRYEGVAFARMVDIADAIGVRVRKRFELLNRRSAEAVIGRLESVGLDEHFIRKRLAPDLDLNNIQEVVERVSSIFGWSPEVLLASSTVDLARLGGETARFKMPKGREGRSAAVYTAYAYRLAGICATAMAGQASQNVPADWRVFRQALLRHYDTLEFRTALSFAWDLGVAVLPLNDPGAFHGACWRIRGVNVIVLKQALRYPARWLFDLLHELRHAAEKPEANEFEALEGSEISEERRMSQEERQASWFSGQVALNGQAEELVKECLEVANGDLRRLKIATQIVAARRKAALGQLANYIAFRLSLQGENWWGTASKLQDKSYDPLTHARQVFFERFAFSGVGGPDLNLLTLALHDEVENA